MLSGPRSRWSSPPTAPATLARVHITLRNTSEVRVIFAFFPPQDLFKLIIKREGKSIAPIAQPVGYAAPTLAWVELKPAHASSHNHPTLVAAYELGISN